MTVFMMVMSGGAGSDGGGRGSWRQQVRRARQLLLLLRLLLRRLLLVMIGCRQRAVVVLVRLVDLVQRAVGCGRNNSIRHKLDNRLLIWKS